MPYSYVKIISQAKNRSLRHTKPILFKKFFASAMCIRRIYECYQLHRYTLCVVVVIVCNEHWEHVIQIELTCNSKLFSL